ncbi:MAG: hypothetical protein JNN27_22060 [Planctomycetes bacterium]|nr:hypothetical protein [Planctomycetota bacterium]
MLRNSLAPKVAEDPTNPVVRSGAGKAARDWPRRPVIVATLRRPDADEGLLVSGELAAALARATPPLTA